MAEKAIQQQHDSKNHHPLYTPLHKRYAIMNFSRLPSGGCVGLSPSTSEHTL